MQFVCRVGTPEGHVQEEVRQARDEISLRRELEQVGYHIFEVRRRGLMGLGGLNTLKSSVKRVAPRDLLIFNQELTALLRAGLPLLQSLNLLLERQKDAEFRATLVDVRDRVESGEALSEAMAAQGAVFPPLYAPTVTAGERSGDLEEVLERFVRYQQLVLEARKKVVTAFVYPAVLVALSLILIAVMLLYVVPGFESFFSDLGSDLPLLTRVIVALSDLLIDYWMWWLGALLVVTVLGIRTALSTKGSVWLDRLKVRIPFIGPILHKFALSEFCLSLATLLAGGTPLVNGLPVAVGAVSNLHIRRLLGPVRRQVAEGQPFHQTLENTGIFPDVASDLVKVGEATGALETMLSTVSDFLDDEIDTSLQRILSLIEPLMLVIMGVVIATLLIAVYLPLSSALGNVK